MNLLNWINSFTIFGLEIKFYGILMAIAFLVGFLLTMYLCKIKKYDSILPYDLILIIFPLSIIFARLFYVIFYNDRQWTFAQILDIRSGGLAIYGGIIGGIFGIIIYYLIKYKKDKFFIVKIFDLLAPSLILGQAIGRWGNFFNQEAHGAEILNESLQWFPVGVLIDNTWYYATFFYESIWCLLGFFLLFFLYKKTSHIGLTTCSYLAFYGFERMLVEGLRTDSLMLGNVRVSQLISALLFIGGLIGVVVILIKNKKNKEKIFNTSSKVLDNTKINGNEKSN